ncbi:MAG: hypothetical protein O7A09_08320 [Proteobacteria bacterium]|nr:hypothetical protein [Pseudomonadota bacterium]MCZ6782563.1 hypothetical protein [Pseudomonadota bacterium]
MSDPVPRPRMPRTPSFTPRFTLVILYLFVFFMATSLLLILPDLMDVLAEVPTGPEQQRVAEERARAAMSGRLLPAFFLAVVGVGLGTYYRVLPGLRSGP